MSTENWPEPVGRVVELHSLDAVDIHVEEMPNVGETIYTASQVREIVAAELEECAKLAESKFSNVAEKLYGQELAALIREKIKENTNADR